MSSDMSRQMLRAPLFKGEKKIVIRKGSTLMPPERRGRPEPYERELCRAWVAKPL